jgi:hypothetical protein
MGDQVATSRRLRSLCREFITSDGFFHRLRALRDGQGLRLAPTGFYLRLFGHPLAAGLGARALDTETLMLLSQVASTAGFLWQAAHTAFRDSE